ncbi:MAG TPA: M48 family metallopeptidase [Candidatus Acidoferrum sp.]|nr:M48 family metallopeptidase [Candidatus Acidoferrum sp.]
MSAPLVIYEGFVFREGEEDQAQSGRFQFTLSHLEFEQATGTLQLPLSRLTLNQNDAGNLVFHDAGTGWWVESADRRILQDLFLLRQTHLRGQARELRERQESGRTLKFALLFLVVFAAIFTAGWLLVKLATDAVVAHTPLAWEEKLTDKVIAEHPRIFILETNDTRSAMVTQLVARIAAALPPAEQRYQFRAFLIDRREPNAFALPGGRIFVFTGLLDRIQRPEQLAGVLAHEMAHVTRRHGLHKLIAGGGPYYVLRLFVSDQQEVLSTISAGSQLLVNESYSRDIEREADNVGWHYLLAANIDPRGLADFFQLLTEGENADNIPQMFRSHPATSERIAALNKLWEKSERRSGFADLSAEFKSP